MANIIIKQKPDDDYGKKLYSQIAFILVKSGVSIKEVDNCLSWAFGPDCLTVAPAEWPARWNKLHPKAFRAKSKDKFVTLIFVVGFMYKLAQAQTSIDKNGGKR